MDVGPSSQTRGSREGVDILIGAIAGLYVAALISPPILLIVAERFPTSTVLLTLGLVGLLLTTAVTWSVTRWRTLPSWTASTWLAWLLPGIAAVSIVLYHDLFFRYVVGSVTDLEASGAALIGFIGYGLAVAASCLGVTLVYLARNHLASGVVSENDVHVEWTAGPPKRRSFKIRIAAVMIVVALFGVSWFLQPVYLTFGAIYVGLLFVIGIGLLRVDHTYRVTAMGFVRTRNRWLHTTQRLFSWETFDGFSVTDDAIVLHRPLPYVDVRWSRADIVGKEPAIVEALEEHLDRRT